MKTMFKMGSSRTHPLKYNVLCKSLQTSEMLVLCCIFPNSENCVFRLIWYCAYF